MVFFFFFNGLSFHLSAAFVHHLFGFRMTWGSTSKEVQNLDFWREVLFIDPCCCSDGPSASLAHAACKDILLIKRALYTRAQPCGLVEDPPDQGFAGQGMGPAKVRR